MRLYAILYVIFEASRNIRSNILTTILTALTLALSLSVFTLFVIFLINIKGIITQWGSKIHIAVYLKDGVQDKDIGQIISVIKGMEGVEDVRYISKHDALELLKRDLKGYEGLLDNIDKNPLPASIEVKLLPSYRKKIYVDRVVMRLEDINGIDDIQYGQRWLERFSAIFNFLEFFTLVMGLFLVAAMFFIISNTVRLTFYARKEDIEIARLVGATDLYIKLPFYIEGIVHGIVGATLASCIIYSVQYILSLRISPIFQSVISLPLSFIVTTGILILAGIFIGLASSMISMGRFGRV